MKKLLLLTLTGLIATSLLGCENSSSTGPQPTAGNEAPKYGAGSVKSGPLGRIQGKTDATPPKTLSNKTASEP